MNINLVKQLKIECDQCHEALDFYTAIGSEAHFACNNPRGCNREYTGQTIVVQLSVKK